MKRILLLILLGVLMNTALTAAGRFVLVEYKHSLRGQHNEISIELRSVNNYNRDFYGKLITVDKRLADHIVTEKVVDLDKEYFDTLFSDFLSLNFLDIIKDSETLSVQMAILLR